MNIIFHHPIKSASGKLFPGSNMYFRTNPVTGAVHTGTLRHPFRGVQSKAQQETRERFRIVMAEVKNRLHNTEEKARLAEEYKNQHEIGTLVGFVYHKVNEELA